MQRLTAAMLLSAFSLAVTSTQAIGADTPDKSWIEQSNAYTHMLLDVHLEHAPEEGSQQARTRSLVDALRARKPQIKHRRQGLASCKKFRVAIAGREKLRCLRQRAGTFIVKCRGLHAAAPRSTWGKVAALAAATTAGINRRPIPRYAAEPVKLSRSSS